MKKLIIVLVVTFASVFSCTAADSIDLSGQWTYKLDPDKVGSDQKWFSQDFTNTLNLPGSLVENGIGYDINLETKWTGLVRDPQWHKDPRYQKYTNPDDFKFPFWLQPEKCYLGPAWYRKQITIPEKWKEKEIILYLERCHWQTTVWLDDKLVGTQNSLSTPHEYKLGTLKTGSHKITVCVDNTVKIDVGQDAHSVAFHTQTNWNGIIGEIKLIAKDPVKIDDVQVYPNINSRSANLKLALTNDTANSQKINLSINSESFNSKKKHTPPDMNTNVIIPPGQKTIEFEYSLGSDCLLWDEFSPNLYKLNVSVATDEFSDEKTVTFGMREFRPEGTQFTINDRKTFLRGTLECCIFPLTGYPPTDVKEWTRIITAAKSHGLNHFRFHSHCPPRAAFQAADNLGFYFQIEGPFWTAVGEGDPLDKYIYDECDRILTEYGNHPSFCLMAYGNEPGGKNQNRFLGDLVNYWKQNDPRHAYTSAAGWPMIPENQYHCTYGPRIQHWGEGLASRVNSKPPETVTDYRDHVEKSSVPIVSHEIGQWCVYPNFDEIEKYTGVLKAKNFEIFRDILAKNHMADLAKDFLAASGKLQTLLYKEDIESALRTPGFGGFQLLDLHDFPGQGTALVGILDPFWEYKGYVTADEYKRFCSHIVPLARMPKLTLTADETFIADIEIANFGPAPIQNAKPTWKITNPQGKPLVTGVLAEKTIPVGNCIPLGKVIVPLSDIKKATKLKLYISLKEIGIENDWDFWVYPAKVDTKIPDEILIANYLDENTLVKFKPGTKVLLIPSPGTVRGDKNGRIPPGFSSIFWNTAWTNYQPPHTLGILCDPAHPALQNFPTDFHSNWQWQPLILNSQTMILNEMPSQLKPIVRVIDDWFTNRRLGLVFEANVNDASVLVCGIDLQKNIASRPVAKQLLNSLLTYMQSGKFQPQVDISADSLKSLFKEPSIMIGSKVIKADSFHPGYEPHNVIDGDPATIWHTPWSEDALGYPHEIQIQLRKSKTINGFTLLPRQDVKNGLIADYEFYVSKDNTSWGQPVAKGTFKKDFEEKQVMFDKHVEGKYIRLVALTPANKNEKFTAVSEIDIITE